MEPLSCKPEVIYCTYDKECLGVIHCLKAWRPYLEGSDFKVCTGPEALKWLQTQRDLNKRQARWLTVLDEFDFEIKYRPGKQNVLADAMSRPPREPVPDKLTGSSQLCTLRSEIASPLLEKIKEAQKVDDLCRQVLKLSRERRVGPLTKLSMA